MDFIRHLSFSFFLLIKFLRYLLPTRTVYSLTLLNGANIKIQYSKLATLEKYAARLDSNTLIIIMNRGHDLLRTITEVRLWRK